ncbi:hypothetical protein HWV62_26869 [Athelia sp. TMB]|nr:hypothetical protein HWV62_26869 [Athelia sp. TMB]
MIMQNIVFKPVSCSVMSLLIGSAAVYNIHRLSQWFFVAGPQSDLDAHLQCLLDVGDVLEPDCNNRGNQLRKSGHQFYDGKYNGHFDNLFNSTDTSCKAMGNDTLNVRFGEDWARLTRDLLFDSKGRLKFKPELWNDVRKVGYIPIPRIEYTDDALDLVVENLTLLGRNLFSNIVSLEAHNFIKFSPQAVIQDENHREFTLTFRPDASGHASATLGSRRGSHCHGASRLVEQGQVLCVQGQEHRSQDPQAARNWEKLILKAIRNAITTGTEYVDGQLVGVRDRYAASKPTKGASRTQVLQDTFAHKDDVLTTASHAQAKASQFKVVHNKRERERTRLGLSRSSGVGCGRSCQTTAALARVARAAPAETPPAYPRAN